MTTHISKIAAVVLAMSSFAPRVAQACDMAEKLRIGEEQKKLASRNAWTGVERAYASLLDTKCELSFDQHFLGAEAARFLGKTWELYERLAAAKAIEEREEIVASMKAIDSVYGRVDIKGDARRRPELIRAEMPFAPDQRKSIEYAQTVMAATGSFYGMLPEGAYVVGPLDVTVTPGSEWQEIVVGKVKGPKAPKGEKGGSEGAVNYANLVATIGPGLIATPESDKVITLADGGHQFAPGSITATGFGLQVGGEVGLTYAEPVMGVAATLGYSGGFGTATVHAVNGWLAGVVRPGDFRFALGPQYTLVYGQGTGVAQWFDRSEDIVEGDTLWDRNELKYGGHSWGPGIQGSAGYGLLDFDKLQGVVEIGGSWHTDGARSYFTTGLRVGIVPTVPRFEG